MRGEYDAGLEDVSRMLVAMADAMRAAMIEATASRWTSSGRIG